MRHSGQQETVLGDLVADAIRLGTAIGVGVINGGAMRLNEIIPPGPLWFYTIESIFQFADETRIVTVSVSGQRLREILENSVSERNFGSGGFLQVSGIKFIVDRGRPSGARIAGPVTTSDRQHDLYPDQIVPAQPPGVSRMPRWRWLQDPGGGRGLRLRGLGDRASPTWSWPIFGQRLGGRIAPPTGVSDHHPVTGRPASSCVHSCRRDPGPVPRYRPRGVSVYLPVNDRPAVHVPAVAPPLRLRRCLPQRAHGWGVV